MRLLTTFLLLLAALLTSAQSGYEIKVTIDGYEEPELYLANHFGDKQYVKDTTAKADDGTYTFKGEETLQGGVYLLVLAPDNNIVQLMIDEDQHFSVKANKANLGVGIEVEGCQLNTDFYNYLSFLTEQRPKANKLNEELGKARDAKETAKVDQIKKELEGINKDVGDYQKNVISTQSNTFLGKIVQASIPVDVPAFLSDPNPDLKRYVYNKEHWFDYIDLADSRFMRAPIMFEKINYYIEKLTLQIPDSLSKSIDVVLEKVKPNEEAYQFYVTYFLNKYASSKIVGMDAVYVHLVNKYYASGETPWVDEEQLEKIKENAVRLEPILIGKIAPDIAIQEIDVEGTLERKDNENEHKRYAVKKNLNLHDIQSKYTVLLIWAPDCGHCKKSMPDIVKFYDKYKTRGVELVALCSSIYKDIPECAAKIQELDMIRWVNTIDPYIKSKYKQLYDVRSTPQIFILDENKEIMFKRISGEQLDGVMKQILENETKEVQEKKAQQ